MCGHKDAQAAIRVSTRDDALPGIHLLTGSERAYLAGQIDIIAAALIPALRRLPRLSDAERIVFQDTLHSRYRAYVRSTTIYAKTLRLSKLTRKPEIFDTVRALLGHLLLGDPHGPLSSPPSP